MRWRSGTSSVLRQEKHDNTLYDEFRSLRDCFLRIEEKQRNVVVDNILPSNTEIKEFLTHEAVIEADGD
jgi:hypothetical protein